MRRWGEGGGGWGLRLFHLAPGRMSENWNERADILRVSSRCHCDHALLDAAADAIHSELRENEVAWMAARGPVVAGHVRGASARAARCSACLCPFLGRARKGLGFGVWGLGFGVWGLCAPLECTGPASLRHTFGAGRASAAARCPCPPLRPSPRHPLLTLKAACP